ncbi:hypothetical protein CARUB_v10018981mg, partial [Capsella rubella]
VFCSRGQRFSRISTLQLLMGEIKRRGSLNCKRLCSQKTKKGSSFAIGGEERLSRLNGYLSKVAATAFVCRGGVRRLHLLEIFNRDGMGIMVARRAYNALLVLEC